VQKIDTAWDCGYGNGQVAHDRVPYYKAVDAINSSTKQIAFLNKWKRGRMRMS